MRTNTPLQALLLMNEPGFYEAAQELGKRIVAEGGQNDQQQVVWAFQHVTAAGPARQNNRNCWLLAGCRQRDAKTANTIFASILLNLDETVTRP